MTMADVPDWVLSTFRPPFDQLATEMERLHREARFRVASMPFGSGIFLGHGLHLECWWPGREPHEPEEIRLEVELCHLATLPRINADVSWSPTGGFEAEFAEEWSSSDEWPLATPETLQRLADTMPALVQAFKEAVARGWPKG